MADKYDDAVAFLTDHPECIYDAWLKPYRTDAGCLFKFIPDCFGCLIHVKRRMVELPERYNHIVDKLMADPRIPETGEDITKDMLPAFAEYQRLFDSPYPHTIPAEV